MKSFRYTYEDVRRDYNTVGDARRVALRESEIALERHDHNYNSNRGVAHPLPGFVNDQTTKASNKLVRPLPLPPHAETGNTVLSFK